MFRRRTNLNNGSINRLPVCFIRFSPQNITIVENKWTLEEEYETALSVLLKKKNKQKNANLWSNEKVLKFIVIATEASHKYTAFEKLSLWWNVVIHFGLINFQVIVSSLINSITITDCLIKISLISLTETETESGKESKGDINILVGAIEKIHRSLLSACVRLSSTSFFFQRFSQKYWCLPWILYPNRIRFGCGFD